MGTGFIRFEIKHILDVAIEDGGRSPKHMGGKIVFFIPI
jgi:hypothetical protein